MKNKLIKTRITVSILAFIAAIGGILGVSSLREARLNEESPDSIIAEIQTPINEETAAVDANKNANPVVPKTKIEPVKEEEPKSTPETSKVETENKEAEKTEDSQGEKTDESEPSEDVFDPYSEEAEDVLSDGDISLMWPLEGETLLAYSADKPIYDATLDQFRTNESLWIAAEQGAVVRAAEDGVVEAAESLPRSGNTVTLEHSNGWRTTYGQLEALLVEPGEDVFKGEIIGYVGHTTKYGINQGDHLEFSVHVENESIDPNVAVTE